MDKSFAVQLARHPVIATVYGAEPIEAFIASRATIAIVANIELRKLQRVIQTLEKAGKYAILNIDSCDGLSQDKGGVDYLVDIGVKSIVSTRVATIQRAKRADLVTIQKIFVTDRSTLPRSIHALAESKPHLAQLMPAPILPFVNAQLRKAMPPIVASGFVCTRELAIAAIGHGAVAVSTSDKLLWDLDAKELRR
ncbi:glycerol-3-phosphate responsive antiterminator [Bosea sp. NPDC055332]